MEKFLSKHATSIKGVISCFDRMIFKGHLPINYPDAMERFFSSHNILLKDFGHFVSKQSEILKEHAKSMANNARRPIHYINSDTKKEGFVHSIINRDKISEGLVCIISAVEACNSFRIVSGKGKPDVISAARKCICLYFYFIDRIFGLIHIRIQTWFPFTIQIYINGHEWLSRKMQQHQIAFQSFDNAFVGISDFKRAQKFSDKFTGIKWPRILAALARKVNPLLKTILCGMQYYWVIDQSEFSTDVIFDKPSSLEPLHEQLLKHATLCFSAKDVLTFLGRKLHGNFQGDVLSEFKDRYPGARIKHRMNANWIKMYNKAGCVLRVETVINRPHDFKVLRLGTLKGKRIYGWFPMAKRVSNLYRYAEVAIAANKRYLDALAVVNDLSCSIRSVDSVCNPIKNNGRTVRGLNLLSLKDLRVFLAVLRGEHFIQGFRNKDIRRALFSSSSADEQTRNSARVSRILKCLHIHGLIAKIPQTRRWKPTHLGQLVMSSSISLRQSYFPESLAKLA